MAEGLPTEELQRRFVAFVRAFGLHRPEQTPCGAPIPVSEAHALTVLHQEGPMSQGELGHHLELTKSTVSRLVDQLERRGWARRRPATDDGRRRLVGLSAEGDKVAREIARLRQVRLSSLLDHIPEADRASVLAALDTLVEAARDSRDS
jgi:DNA-binding MarR family transcriptional regulator